MNRITSLTLCLLAGWLGNGWMGTAFAQPPQPTRILFVVGEQEYDTRRTLPEFAKEQLEPRGFDCHFVHAQSDDRKSPECHQFPGLRAQLKQADVLVLSTRRRYLATDQLNALRDWITQGGSVVGIRTSSHGFAARDPNEIPAGHSQWADFDQEVLGTKYEGHWENKVSRHGEPTLLWLDDAQTKHALLRGVTWTGKREFTSHLYKSRNLAPSTTVLLWGQVKDRKEIEPVAWTYQRKTPLSLQGEPTGSGRTFYTSLGSISDLNDDAIVGLLVNAIEWTASAQ